MEITMSMRSNNPLNRPDPFNRLYNKHVQYLNLQGLRVKTIDAYSRAIRRIGDYFDYVIDDLTEDQLLDYFSSVLQSHSISTVKSDLYGLKFFYLHTLKRSWKHIPLVKSPRIKRLPDVLSGNYIHFAQREFSEREAFDYPPYSRLIRLTIKHRQYNQVELGAKLVGHILKKSVQGKVIGPAWHPIPRIRNQYQMTILIKLNRQKGILSHTHSILDQAIVSLKSQKGLSGVRVNVDVDPY